MTVQQVGEKIGRAIAKDVKREGWPTEWTGIDPQDADIVPDGMSLDEVERVAAEVYAREMASE